MLRLDLPRLTGIGTSHFFDNSLLVLLFIFGTCNNVSAAIVQWRNRVPASEVNPSNIGSYTSTIEIGNGGTAGYDAGLDVELDTSIVPNEKFFVTYIDHGANKVEYEFTQELQPGESYTVLLSFENNSTGGSAFAPNTIEFLAADGNITYDLAIDTNDNGSADTFRSGNVADVLQGNGELSPWNQLIFSGNDHRNGWYYGELTITNNAPEPTSACCAGIGIGVLAACTRSERKSVNKS